jgi:hypothetical protein
MIVENHMVIRDREWMMQMSEPDNPCEGCTGYNTSDCCNAPIKWTDICSECGEHCSTQCEDCENR